MQKISWSKRDEPAQLTSKADIHQKKVILSVWWDFKGIVYFELLPRNQTINSNVHCRQLMKFDKEIEEKRPELVTRKGVIFHQDIARPHTSLVTRKKLLELGWEVMPHSPYSLNLQKKNIKIFEKKNIVYNLVDRAISLSHKTFHDANLKIVKQMLLDNGYPNSFIKKNKKIRKNKIKYSPPNSRNKKKTFRFIQTSTKGILTLPYNIISFTKLSNILIKYFK